MGSYNGPDSPLRQLTLMVDRPTIPTALVGLDKLSDLETSSVQWLQERCDHEIMAELGKAEARSRRAFAALPWWVQRKHQALELVYTHILVPSYDTMCAGLDLVEAKGLSALRCKARDLLNWASARIYR